MSGSSIISNITAAGYTPQSPASLQSQVLTLAAASSPGYTANLPGILIEDLSSTCVYSIALCDQAFAELLNSIAPTTANPFLLNLLGQVYGVPIGIGYNTSVTVVFTSSSVGLAIPAGWVVSDGIYQYVTQNSVVIQSSGLSAPVTAISNSSGTWTVPPNTVTTSVTQFPSTYTVSVTNQIAGIPSAGPQTTSQYRGSVMQAGLVSSQGTPNFVKTALSKVIGVNSALISVSQNVLNYWEIIVGGGDIYAVANAIYNSVANIGTLSGSLTFIVGITNTNPAIVTTSIIHGLTTGSLELITGVLGMTGANGSWTITSLSNYRFSIPYNASSAPAYTSGGQVTGNTRNVAPNIIDFPDTYPIPFVIPIQQTVQLTVTWNTDDTNFVNSAVVSQYAQPAIAGYINNLGIGQPINGNSVFTAFAQSVSSFIPPDEISRFVLLVIISGETITANSGTELYYGDREGYFNTNNSLIAVNQG